MLWWLILIRNLIDYEALRLLGKCTTEVLWTCLLGGFWVRESSSEYRQHCPTVCGSGWHKRGERESQKWRHFSLCFLTTIMWIVVFYTFPWCMETSANVSQNSSPLSIQVFERDFVSVTGNLTILGNGRAWNGKGIVIKPSTWLVLRALELICRRN